MTPEATAALIISQSAAALIEALGMAIADLEALQQDKGVHSQEAYLALRREYGIEYNTVLTALSTGRLLHTISKHPHVG